MFNWEEQTKSLGMLGVMVTLSAFAFYERLSASKKGIEWSAIRRWRDAFGTKLSQQLLDASIR